VRIFHKVKHRTNGDVKCLANAFDKYANVDFGRLTEQFGGIEDYHEVEYFTKAMKRLLMRFTQKRSTKPSNKHPPCDYFHAVPTQPCEIFIKGDHG